MSYARPTLSTPATTPMSHSSTMSSLHYASSGYHESEPLSATSEVEEERQQPDGSAEASQQELKKVTKDIVLDDDVTNAEVDLKEKTVRRDDDEDEEQLECAAKSTEDSKDANDKYMEKFDASLHQYYQEYVCMDDAKKIEVLEIVEYVRDILVEAFKVAMPKHEIVDCTLEEALLPQLHSIHIHAVRLLLQFKPLDSDLWQLQNGVDSVYNAPGYCLIKRYNQSFFGPGSSPYDQHLIADYLSGRKLRCVFLEMCHRGLNWGDAYRVLPAVTGDNVTLQIYKDNALLISVEFVPSVVLNGVVALALPHPGAMEDAGLENLWVKQEQDYPKYLKGIEFEDQKEKNVKICMRVLRSIAQNHTEMSLFTEDVVMSAVMHCAGQIQECTTDTENDVTTCDVTTCAQLCVLSWKYLAKCLEEQKLPSYTCAEHNLIAPYAGPMMEYTTKFMQLVINRNLYDQLLINKNV